MKRLLLLLFLAGCSQSAPGTPAPSSANGWQWWSSGAFSGVTYGSFTFPTGDPSLNHIDYLTEVSGQLTRPTLTADFTISTPATFQANPSGACPTPPSVHLFFAVRGYTVYPGPSDFSTQRWWSNPIYLPLKSGETELTVPLTPDQWSDVSGKTGTSQLAAFNAAKANAGYIGLTFGGGCAFGHGVNTVEPGVTFTLKDLAQQ